MLVVVDVNVVRSPVRISVSVLHLELAVRVPVARLLGHDNLCFVALIQLLTALGESCVKRAAGLDVRVASSLVCQWRPE